MNNKIYPALLLSVIPIFNALADDNGQIINTTKFETVLGGTRLIYPLQSSGAAISVKNPQNYPILVQSKVVNPDKIENDNMVSDESFIVTPPLFRLDGMRQTSLKVVRIGGDFPNDRESIRYLCVKGIPPEQGDVWAVDKKNNNKIANVNLNIATQTCIKLIIRPELSGSEAEASRQLSWHHEPGFLVADNKTAFYIQPSYINLNGRNIENVNYIKPFSAKKFALNFNEKKTKIDKVNWAYIDSNGAVSSKITSSVK